jgi:hypothetical protein
VNGHFGFKIPPAIERRIHVRAPQLRGEDL